MDDERIKQLRESLDAAMMLTLKQMQSLIRTLVNIRDTEQLTHLQMVMHQLFKDAAATLDAGLYYEIDKDDGRDLQ